MNIRKLAFKALDYIKGSPVRSGVSDLEQQFSNGFDQAMQRREAIIQHVAETVPYYRKFKGCSFEEYPVMNKRIIKEDQSAFVSSKFSAQLEKLHKATTSGSYGTPFTFYLDPEKRAKMVSEVYYFGRSSGFDIGVKHAYAVAKNKNIMKQLVQNQVMLPVSRLDDDWCFSALKALRRSGAQVLVGYASAIERLANYLIDNQDGFRLSGVITISEVLSEEARYRIKEAFLCTPISRYSTEELGVLGNQDASGDFFHINQCNYFVEVLELDSAAPVSLGRMGRIVVTDYYNKSQPLIRYDIGDLARPVEIKNGLVTKIDAVEGRRLSVIRSTDGEVISSFKINGALRESKGIVQFQFSQEEKREYLLKVVAKDKVDEISVVGLYKGILGEDAVVKVAYVKEIEPLPSGKRPYIIQNFYDAI
ncbi:hypothetical protein [Halomonas mongoliensis]|uniref:hypothetical protein n=1 Tax=Halomonas mongoliensis TaxID=321265 RepID=UPI00403B1281